MNIADYFQFNLIMHEYMFDILNNIVLMTYISNDLNRLHYSTKIFQSIHLSFRFSKSKFNYGYLRSKLNIYYL